MKIFLFIMATTILVHGVSLFNPFYYDDVPLIQKNRWVEHGPPTSWYRGMFLDHQRNYSGYRPTLMHSYALSSQLTGHSPASQRWVNILLHGLNAFLLYLLFSQLMGFQYAKYVVLMCLLFVCHPIQTLAVNFIWKRSTLLCVFFIVCALNVRLYRQRVHSTAYSSALMLIELAIYALALTSKELAVVYLPIIACLDWSRRVRQELVGRWMEWLTLAIVSAMTVYNVWHVFYVDRIVAMISTATVHIADMRQATRYQYFLTSIRTLWEYIVLAVVPQPRLIDDPLHVTSLPWRQGLLVLSLLASSVWVMLRKCGHPAFVLSVAIYWLSFVPTTSVFPIYFVQDQIRMYLPLAGFCFIATFAMRYGLMKLGREMWAVPILMVIVFGYGTVSVAQNLRYRNPFVIWSDVLEAYPHSDVALDHLGMMARDAGFYNESAAYYYSAFSQTPAQWGFYIKSLYSEYLAQVDRQVLRDKVLLIPEGQLQLQSYVDWGVLLAAVEETAKAEQVFLKSIQQLPSYVNAHYNLALLWLARGDYTNAKKALHNTLALDPHHVRAKQHLVEMNNFNDSPKAELDRSK